jgi:hypothetical protein
MTYETMSVIVSLTNSYRSAMMVVQVRLQLHLINQAIISITRKADEY